MEAEAKKRDWEMNVAVVDSGGNLVAFQRMDGAMLASIRIAEHKARAAATFRRETKFFEKGIQVSNLNYLLTLEEIVASWRYSTDRAREADRRDRLFGRCRLTG